MAQYRQPAFTLIPHWWHCTRFIKDPHADGITGIEISTPGLKGQSGWPLFDANGTVYGMQFATNDLHPGFDIKDKEVIINGKKKTKFQITLFYMWACVCMQTGSKHFLHSIISVLQKAVRSYCWYIPYRITYCFFMFPTVVLCGINCCHARFKVLHLWQLL